MDDTILARVGERTITKQEVEELRKLLGEQAEHFQGEEGDSRLLEEIIHQELLYRDAMDKKMDEEEEFQKQLDAQIAMIKKQLLQQYALQKLLSAVQVLPQEVEEYYRANEEHFSEEEKKNPDRQKSQIYMQLLLLRQQATYVNYTGTLEKTYPVTRMSISEEKEENHE
ncbi:hypothetical protein [Murdochiella massiliensis]|uniref:hypothetical protein n=1 Tax=Murdochiella massiliensis TaxID=1673723 RepID=UPI000837819B|nr:hypothetical protein [Murdochiella massiliensis]